MNLLLHSGGTVADNRKIARECAKFLPKNAQLAFIPADSAEAGGDFRWFQSLFSGFKNFHCFHVDGTLSAKERKRLLSCDVIFLGGGNTFYFLHHLRRQKLLSAMKSYVKKGGFLMGLSAGSILMTPSIKTASIPSLDSDDNEVGVKEFSAMGLVPFEFSPHYVTNRKADQELKEYSKKVPYPIYACSDGEAILIRNGELRFIGEVTAFHGGLKYTVQ